MDKIQQLLELAANPNTDTSSSIRATKGAIEELRWINFVKTEGIGEVAW